MDDNIERERERERERDLKMKKKKSIFNSKIFIEFTSLRENLN